MSKAPSRTQDQFIVRLPDGMRDRIKIASEANNRSMNAEIVAALEDKFPFEADIDQIDLAVFTIRNWIADDDSDVEEISIWLDKIEDGLDSLRRRLAKGK